MASEAPHWVYGTKSSFAAGELTPTLEGRPDLPLYQNGARKIINWMILPSGGLTRRPGTEFIWGKRTRESLDEPVPDRPVPTAQDLASRLFRLKRNFEERAPFFDYATLEPRDNGQAPEASHPAPALCPLAPVSRQRRMIHLPYSRELSLLLAFERTSTGQLAVSVFPDGKTLLQTLTCTPGRPFCLKAMTYATYQGVLYLCLGLSHPLYRFRVDEDLLAQFQGQTQLPSPAACPKNLFSLEALEWPVTTYTPQHITELLQVDMEKANETLKQAAEEEESKAPLLLRTQALAPFANRLWCFGAPDNSHQITASAKGDFADFNVAYESLVQARNPLSPLIGTFVSETFDPVLWAVPFGEELLVGTTDGIYVLKEGMRDKGEFVKIHKELNMGVAPIRPVVLDKALFFVEGSCKNVSCLTWSRERGGYQVHSLTSYADHLFTSGIVRLEGVRTPFNMLFALLGDGHFAIFTHDADLKGVLPEVF